MPRVQGNPYVIAGNKAGAHLVESQKPWRRLRAKANLTDVRIHDLRHSFASVAAGVGMSLPLIGRPLNAMRILPPIRFAPPPTLLGLRSVPQCMVTSVGASGIGSAWLQRYEVRQIQSGVTSSQQQEEQLQCPHQDVVMKRSWPRRWR
jgi:hypothetical protein